VLVFVQKNGPTDVNSSKGKKKKGVGINVPVSLAAHLPG
jgi:hypothetical protein